MANYAENILILTLFLVALLGASGLVHGANLTPDEAKAIHAMSEQCKQGNAYSYSACMVRATGSERFQWKPPLTPPVPGKKE
jgi:hypothetical protein